MEKERLTDLWKEAGSDISKKPAEWQEAPYAVEFINTTCKILNIRKSDIINSRRGKNGGTWAHKQIALAYARYLDPKLHVLVTQIFFERIEEEKNPDLIFDRGIKTYQKQGKSLQWIEKRVSGKLVINEFISILARHRLKEKDSGIAPIVFTILFMVVALTRPAGVIITMLWGILNQLCLFLSC